MPRVTEIEQLARRQKRRRRRRNLLVFLLAAALIFALFYARNSQEFRSFLSTTVLGDTGYQEGDGFPVEFVGADTLDMQALASGGVAVLNSSKAVLLNARGGVEREFSHQMMNPRMVLSGDRTLLYDFGGKTWQLYSGSKVIRNETLDSPIYGADLVETGAYVVASGSNQDLSLITGYTRENSVSFQWRSSSKLVTNLVMDDTGREIAFTTVSAREGELITHLYVYRLDKKEPLVAMEFPSEITISLRYRYNGSITLLTDRSLTVIGGSGKVIGSADFQGEMVSAYTDRMSRYTVVVLGDYSNTKNCQVVFYGMKGEEALRYSLGYPVKKMKATANSLYLYTERGLFQYGEDGLLKGRMPVLGTIDFVPTDTAVYYMTFDGLERGTMERAG